MSPDKIVLELTLEEAEQLMHWVGEIPIVFTNNEYRKAESDQQTLIRKVVVESLIAQGVDTLKGESILGDIQVYLKGLPNA